MLVTGNPWDNKPVTVQTGGALRCGVFVWELGRVRALGLAVMYDQDKLGARNGWVMWWSHVGNSGPSVMWDQEKLRYVIDNGQPTNHGSGSLLP